MRNKLLLLVSLLFVSAANAATIDQPLADAHQEQAARTIFHELRCVVCEGQSLAESDAALAVQMRDHVRELVHAGKTEPEILDYFRARYGEHILLTPPLESYTLLLWFAPLLLLFIGGILVWRTTRQHHGANL